MPPNQIPTRLARHLGLLGVALLPLPGVWALDEWLLAPSGSVLPLDFRGLLVGAFVGWWALFAVLSTVLARGLEVWRYAVSGVLAVVGPALAFGAWKGLEGRAADRAHQAYVVEAQRLADVVELVAWDASEPGRVTLRATEALDAELGVHGDDGRALGHRTFDLPQGEVVTIEVDWGAEVVTDVTDWVVHLQVHRDGTSAEIEWRRDVVERTDEGVWSIRPLP